MKKIYLSSIVLILCVLIYPNIANAGLSEGCSAYTCLADQDYYAGDCKTHIETLNDCTNIPADGYQKAFNCTVGCTQSFIPLINWKPEVGKVWYSAGNVGIGTDTPSWKLHVEGTMGVVGDVLVQNNIDAMGNLQIDGSGRIVGDLKVEGNVGIGTSSPETKFHIKDSNNVYTRIENNTGNQSAIQFADSSDAGEWVVGIHGGDANKFKIAKSTALQTNTALTINESLNVGIGTATPSAKLDVLGTARFTNIGIGTSSPDTSIEISASSGLSAFRVTDTTNNNWHEFGHGDSWGVYRTSTNSDGWRWEHQNNVILSTYTKMMELNKYGHLGIQASASSAYPLYVYQDLQNYTAYFNNSDNTVGAHGLRIRAGQDLGISTSTNLILFEDGDGTDIGRITGSGGNSVYMYAGNFIDEDNTTYNVNPDGTSVLQTIQLDGRLYDYDDATDNYYLNPSATTILNSLTVNSFTNTSDIRLKENIKDLEYGLSEVMKLRPVSFNWKDKEVDNVIGLIAQEVQPIVNEVVRFNEDDEDKMLGIAYTELIPVLISAIQEQQTVIESLTIRIETLEM